MSRILSQRAFWEIENYLLPFDKEDYQIDPPSMNMFQAELNSIKGVKVDRTPWYLSIDISYLHPFEKEANNGNSYSKALDNSLSWDSGIGVELATYYQLTSYLEIGLGINYTKLFERFRLKNEIVVEHIVVNSEAFLHRGTYIEAEQCVETIITQDIANNNSLNRFFLIPKLAGVFYLGEFRIRSGVGVPISLYQNYSGILFDTSDLRIHDGDIFDERKYSIIGLQLSNSISRHISQAVEIGLKFNYSRFGSTDVDDRIYNRNTLNVIDIGISGTYHF